MAPRMKLFLATGRSVIKKYAPIVYIRPRAKLTILMVPNVRESPILMIYKIPPDR